MRGKMTWEGDPENLQNSDRAFEKSSGIVSLAMLGLRQECFFSAAFAMTVEATAASAAAAATSTAAAPAVAAPSPPSGRAAAAAAAVDTTTRLAPRPAPLPATPGSRRPSTARHARPGVVHVHVLRNANQSHAQAR